MSKALTFTLPALLTQQFFKGQARNVAAGIVGNKFFGA